MNLQRAAFSGLLYSALDLLFTKGSVFLTSLYLARILGPAQFGLISLITIFISVGTILVDSGFSASIIRSNDVSETDYSTIFFTNIIIAFVIYLIFFLIAPYIASFYKQHSLTDIIRVFCLTFILNAFSSVQTALLIKKLNFKKVMIFNLPSNTAGAIVGILLVHKGFGIWSVIFMYITSQFVYSSIVWYFSSWRPKFIFSIESLKSHFDFGSKLMLSALLNTFFENIFNVILGKYYNSRIAGYYERAKTLNEYPVILIATILSKVAYPMLSQIRSESERVAGIYKQLIQITFFFAAPLMLSLAMIAKPIIITILGPDWSPAIPYFQILCLSSIIYPIHVFNINVLQVFGRSDLFLKLEIYKKVAIFIVICISIKYGIYVMLIGSVMSSYIALIINGFYSQKMISYPLKQQLIDLLPTVLISFIGIFVIALVQYFINDFTSFSVAILALSTGLFTYLLIHYIFKTTALSYLFQIIKKI